MRIRPVLLLAAAGIFPVAADAPSPFLDETLHYTVNWPSGLSLGEGQMSAKLIRGNNGESDHWSFELDLDASVPGYSVKERHRATATPAFCSIEFDKSFTRGKRKAEEKVKFDPQGGTAERVTQGGGGKSQIQVSACAKDALTFLYYVRSELARGRVPPPQIVVFGAPYQVHFEYRGAQMLRIGESQEEADKLVAAIQGPKSQISVELYFARDPARTPLRVRLPLALGVFSLEIVR